MQILTKPIKLAELQIAAEKMFGNLVKGVVDTERAVVAIDAELHSDLAETLVTQGSKGVNLWGFDVYPTIINAGWLEFDSMLNVKPLANNRTRAIEDPVIREKAELIIKKYILP